VSFAHEGSVKAVRVWKSVAVAAAAATTAAVLGIAVTDLGPWYYGLKEPAWKPPDWLFGPAWTLIFITAAMAGLIGWWSVPARRFRLQMLSLFALNIFLNTLWSYLFFRAHRPDWALYEVGFLWLSIAALIWLLWPAVRTAAWLLTPYLAWVAFAAAVNRAVVQLNGPFSG
jgi:tryptophan-rich sensory protein